MCFGIGYCKYCKEDNERIRLGYNPHNPDCGRWQCHLIDGLNLIGVILLLIPLFILLIPILILIKIFDFMTGDNNGVQRQGDGKDIQKKMVRTKQRKHSVGKLSMAQRKSRA